MSRIKSLMPGDSHDAEANAILQAFRDGIWKDVGMWGGWAHQPELLKGSFDIFSSCWPGVATDGLLGYLVEMMRIKFAYARGCAYCTTIRTKSVQNIIGPKEVEINQYQPKAGKRLTEREALAVCFAERMMTDPKTIDDEFFGELRGHYNDDELVELIVAAAMIMLGSGYTIAMQLDNEEEGAIEYQNVLADIGL